MPSAPHPAAPPGPPASAGPARRWSGRSLGGALLFRVGSRLLPLLGVRGAWAFSYLAGLAFLLIGGRTCFHQLDFWRRLRPRAGTGALVLSAWRQFASFGRILGDRLLVAWRPGRFTLVQCGGDGLRALRAQGRGCILLSAHFGNWELCSYYLRRLSPTPGSLHLVMVRQENAEVQAYLDRLLRGAHVRIIDARDGIGAALAIRAALAEGGLVCMHGDRVFENQPSVPVRFLGGTVRMPIGPFHAAALTGAPIVTSFMVKTGLARYEMRVDAPWTITLPARGRTRDAALGVVVQRWARRLELEVRQHPQQWHNFFAYWG
jgi:predicted LPLAT superfamily acyltransferase